MKVCICDFGAGTNDAAIAHLAISHGASITVKDNDSLGSLVAGIFKAGLNVGLKHPVADSENDVIVCIDRMFFQQR